MSAASNASANRLVSWRSRADRGAGALSRPAAGSWAASVARARCRALLTDTSLTASISAACPAG